MSTGYGKSAIYQIAALLIPGPTVVVSPLIALQSDQVEDLEREKAGGAAAVSSFVPAGARRGGPRGPAPRGPGVPFFSPRAPPEGGGVGGPARARPPPLLGA